MERLTGVERERYLTFMKTELFTYGAVLVFS